MRIVPDNAQHIGARSEQQDAFGFSDLQKADLTRRIGALCVVADGMGGLEHGQEVSRAACRIMIDAYSREAGGQPIPRALSRALQAANQEVVQRATQLDAVGRTGTTLAAAVIHDAGLHWISVGDSRVYLYRDGTLTQLTVDHGYGRHLDRQAAAGEISAAEAAQHPDRHAITSFLGLEELEEVDRTLKPLPLQPGDRVLLCTDGLHGSLTDDEIAGILQQRGEGAAQALVDAAVAKGRKNQDNTTVALLNYSPAGAAAGTLVLDGGSKKPPATAGRRPATTRRAAAVVLALVLVGAGAVALRFSDADGHIGRAAGHAGRAMAAIGQRLPFLPRANGSDGGAGAGGQEVQPPGAPGEPGAGPVPVGPPAPAPADTVATKPDPLDDAADPGAEPDTADAGVIEPAADAAPPDADQDPIAPGPEAGQPGPDAASPDSVSTDPPASRDGDAADAPLPPGAAEPDTAEPIDAATGRDDAAPPDPPALPPTEVRR